jgi:oligopeptide/dipeptide ABC transporter ATP-binding protein
LGGQHIQNHGRIRVDDLTSTTPLLEVRNLSKEFPVGSGGILSRKKQIIKAVQDVSFSIQPGETLGLVGESGSGKTTLGRSIIRLHEPTSGEVLLDGKNILNLRRSELQATRRRMQIIFQDPYSSLDPRMNVGNIVGEGLLIHNLTNSKNEYRGRVEDLFELVGLSPLMMGRFPHEFSGGQRQRIGIARALAVEPDFIVCDEPVSALDVSIQAQILNLFEELQERLNLAYLFVAHDLSVVRHISDRIAVMYLGRIVEIAEGDELYRNPSHPYTQALISGIPIPDPVIEETRDRIVLTGEIPSPLNPPTGCVFNPRCPLADERCPKIVPELRTVSHDHLSACINADGYGAVGAIT